MIGRQISMSMRHVSKIWRTKKLFLSFSTAKVDVEPDVIPREQMNYDLVTVGGGPAGLAAAIRLKQLAIENNVELSVCVIDKGSAIGSHIISGNVFEPKALSELFPNWKEMTGVPLETQATTDTFLYLTEKSSYAVPHFLLPKQLNNDGNYIISLSKLTAWLAEQAEALGVEIYAGFAADEVLYSSDGTSVIGVATKDAGISKSGEKKDSYTRGIELIGRQTIFAEGARGSCSEEVISKFDLRKDKDVQTYGLGIKEVWRISTDKIIPGHIQHTVGWPLDSQTFGGTFLYHQSPDLIHVGMVVGLDYKNTYISPYQEFQKWKKHQVIAELLKGGECISYGARCLNEGGYHAIPKLTFPGGMLAGCSAGFLNAVKIKGSHTAMKSGMLAAEAIFTHYYSHASSTTTTTTTTNNLSHVDCSSNSNNNDIINPKSTNNTTPSSSSSSSNNNSNSTGKEGCLTVVSADEIVAYEQNIMNSWIIDELKIVRNSHASFKYGLLPGMFHTALSCFITQGKEPWSIHNTVTDSSRTLPAKECSPIMYPKPDNQLTFDLLSNLQRSGTNHDNDQPSHLKIKPNMSDFPINVSLPVYDGPEQRFCPAGVYEYTDSDTTKTSSSSSCQSKKVLTINAQNCVHCKCCAIKTPGEYIKWTVPEGGGGPNYTVM